MNKSLTRSIGFWLLLILSLAAAGVGGWLIAGQVSSMTTVLLANTATGVDVYVGQSLIGVGAVLAGAGVIGILIALALIAVQAIIPAPTPVAAEPIDWTAENPGGETSAAADVPVSNEAPVTPESETAHEDAAQNGSNGSTATATKISVK